jgi:type IV pilus assembly protein PilQ
MVHDRMTSMKKNWPLFLLGLLIFLPGCASQPAKKAAVGQPEAAPQQRAILDVKVVEDEKTAQVTVSADQPLTYTAVKHQFPLAVVLYFPDTSLKGVQETYTPGSPLISTVQTSALERERPSSRIEIRLAADAPYKVSLSGNDVIVLFNKQPEERQSAQQAEPVQPEGTETAQEKPTPQEPTQPPVAAGPTGQPSPGPAPSPAQTVDKTKLIAQAVLQRIDFQVLENGKSRITVETDRKVPWETQKSSEKRLLLRFREIRIPKFQKRPLITTRFDSAVDRVLPVQTEQMGDTAVVTVELREAVSYRAHTEGAEGNIYMVDFEPSSVPPRAMPEAEKPAWIQAMKETESAVTKPAAQQPERPVLTGNRKTYRGEKISLDFQDADIHNIFRILHEVSGKNFVIGEDVKGRVTLKLVNVPWDQVLDLILHMNKLGTVTEGNVVRIATLATLESEQQALANRKKAEEAAKELEPLVTEYVKLNYADAGSLKAHLDETKSPRGKVTVDASTNMIIIQDEEEALVSSRALIKELDAANQEIATRQVLIEARIVEADSSFTRDLGIQWGGDMSRGTLGTSAGNSNRLFGGQTYTARTSTSTPNYAVNLPPASFTSGLGFALGRIAGTSINLDIRLLAMENQGKGRTISAPKVLTLDNQAASIKQVTKIPYQVIEDNTVSIKQEETGIELSVTPQITRDDRIRMKIFAEKGAPDWSNTVAGNPAIDTNTANTELFVNDGQTIVIGGILTTTDTVNEAHTPVLNKIPVLGWLFKQKQTVRSKNELLIFITPKIIRLDEGLQTGS